MQHKFSAREIPETRIQAANATFVIQFFYGVIQNKRKQIRIFNSKISVKSIYDWYYFLYI
jgi:hypothetical protein